MNLQLLHDAPVAFRLADPELPPAALTLPRGFERNYSYPLLALLHDDGCDERQWDALLPGICDRNYLTLAPRAPLPAAGGYAWGADLDAAAAAAARVAAEFPVHRRRVFAVGVGGGGAAAVRLAAARTDLFAGAVALNPRGVGNLAPAWRRRSPAGFLVLHGKESAAAAEAHQWAARLHAAGQTVAHFAFPAGDAATAGMLRAANRWLMDRALRAE